MERDFLTIREIAALAKRAGMASDTMKAWRLQAKRQRWKDMGSGLYRVIDGEPVYHVSVLSQRLRKLVGPPKPDIAAMKARRALDMQAARSTILTATETRAEAAGRSWREVAREFIAAVDAAYRRTIPAQHREIDGFALPYTILREAKGWVPKDGAWSVSLAALYE